MAVVTTPRDEKQSDDFTRNYRRQQLIDATIDSIAEHGISRITLAKVAKAAGLSPGIVNFYFNSKEQLLLETLREMAREFDIHVEAAIGSTEDPELTLLGVINACLDPIVFDRRKAAVWSAFWGESQAREDYLAICDARNAELYATIHQSFAQLCTLESIPDFDAHAAARGFEGMLDGYWQKLLCHGQFDITHAKSTCRGYLRNLFPHRFKKPSPVRAKDSVPVRTLMAPWTYTNKEFFDLEVEQIFKRSWLLAGHTSELQKPGDFVTFDGVNERAIVVRGTDSELRAFHNVCRHRGGRVVRDGKGNCNRAIVCPFHGWTYNLDGGLKNIPAAETFHGLDKSAHGLVPLDLEVWNGFVFIRFGGTSSSVASILRPVAHKAAPYRLENMQPIIPEFREFRSVNWKVVHDIDNEGYHVPVGHPSLHQLFGKSYEDRLEAGTGCSYGYIQDKPARQWSVARYQNLLPHYDHLAEENQKIWFYFPLFPNLVFALYPDSMEYYMTLPVAPDRTLYVSRSFALPDTRRRARAARYLNMRINRQTAFEDESFMDWIQQGIQSSAFPEGALSTRERGVSAFHQEIQERLPIGRLAQQPAAGTLAQTNRDMALRP